MNERDEQIVNRLEVIRCLIQRGAKHVHVYPKMSLRYLREAITDIQTLIRFVVPERKVVEE